MANDTTDKNAMSEAARASEEQYRLALEATADGLWDWDVPTGEVFFGPGWGTILGLDQVEHSYKEWESRIHPEDREEVLAGLQRHLAGTTPQWSMEHRLRAEDGLWKWVLGRGRVIRRDADGRPLRMVGTMADISERKKAERDYRMLFREMLDGFSLHEVICDESGKPVDYRFLAVNPAFERMTGLKAEDVVGRRVLEVLPGVESYWIEMFGGVAITGKPVLFENYSADIGKHFEVTTFQPAPNQFACIFQDVTVRKRAVDALKFLATSFAHLSGRAFYEAVCRQMALSLNLEYIFVGELEPGGDRIRVIGGSALGGPMSELIYDLRGTPCENVVGKYPCHHPSHVQTLYPNDALLAQMKIEGYLGSPIFGKGREPIGILVALSTKPLADPAAITGLFDVYLERIAGEMQRGKAEEALRRSEERFRTLAENIPGVIYLCRNDATYSMLYLSAAVEQLTGHPREDFLENRISFVDLYHPEDAPGIIQRVGQACEERVPFHLVYRIRRRDGQWRWIEEYGTGVYSETDLLLLEGFLTDITGRKKAEEERIRLEEQLRQAQKMESVGRLAGGVAHDFNNMLGVILGHTELAMERIDPTHPLHNDLQEVLKAAERSAELTRQLLAFARKQPVTPRVLSLNETIEGMLRMLKRLIGEGIDLVWNPDRDAWPVRIDPSQIDQILANLCINARDAIEGDGRITIETRNIPLDETFREGHAGFVAGDYLQLSVRDTGRGMDEATLANLFEPFFTTKAIGKGTGLGLATVYGIVRQNDGFIDVESKPGTGTLFRIYLPRYSERTDQALSRAPARAAVSGRETILLVEDQLAILNMAVSMLQRLGYTVVAAGSPSEAILQAERHAGAIQLLMTDVVMPEMNGRTLARILTSRHPGLKLLFMSGYTADVIAHHGILDAGVHFIEKPFSMKALAAKVREALDEGEEGKDDG